MKYFAIALIATVASACSTLADESERPKDYVTAPDKVFIIGQDLDALRGYYASDCCVQADGTTAYLSLYRLRDPSDFGGIGYDLEGVTVFPEASWGSGPVGARQSVIEFGVNHLAIGLFIAENDNPDGLSEIVNGDFDAEIVRLADLIKSVPGQVFLMAPYVLSIAALVIAARSADYPRALLTPWFKSMMETVVSH